MPESVMQELMARGLIAQMTHPEQMEELLGNQKITFYVGFDPTADSLHVGSLVPLIAMAHMQRAGHRPIVVLGGGTGMVGDPTGRTDMRKMLTVEELSHNAACFRRQMGRVIRFAGEGSDDPAAALMVNNADWLLKLNYVDFLRDVGAHFSVNRMLAAECYRQRMERGLSFLELNYMIMQAYDFLTLNRRYHCVLQLGGDDQWSNIIAGAELIRKAEHREAYGMTFPLLLTSEGKKMGKTEGGAIWLDPDKTSPYDFYQYWRNIADADVIKTMKTLTFIPVSEIEGYARLSGSALNPVKEKLAFEVTRMIHGEEAAIAARETAVQLFRGGATAENMPFTALTAEDFSDGRISLLTLLQKTGLAPSKSEGRRLIEQGGISVDDVKINDPGAEIMQSDLELGPVILKKGKKIYHKVILS